MTFVYGIIHYSPATGGPTACRGAGLLAGLFTLQSTSYFNLNPAESDVRFRGVRLLCYVKVQRIWRIWCLKDHLYNFKDK